MSGPFYSPVNVASRTDQAVEVLTELITSGKLASGDFLPSEAELCRQLGISRPTVREALRELETRGLVVCRHGVGIQVTDGTLQAAIDSISLMLRRRGAGPRDMLEVRLMLECQGAALAAERATEEEVGAVAAAIDAMRAQPLTVEANVRVDLDFHLRVAEAAKNEVLLALVHAIRGLLLDTIAATYAVNPEIELRIEDHTRVLAAIRARDAVAAVEAMRTHLRRTEELVFRQTSPRTDAA